MLEAFLDRKQVFLTSMFAMIHKVGQSLWHSVMMHCMIIDFIYIIQCFGLMSHLWAGLLQYFHLNRHFPLWNQSPCGFWAGEKSLQNSLQMFCSRSLFPSCKQMEPCDEEHTVAVDSDKLVSLHDNFYRTQLSKVLVWRVSYWTSQASVTKYITDQSFNQPCSFSNPGTEMIEEAVNTCISAKTIQQIRNSFSLK